MKMTDLAMPMSCCSDAPSAPESDTPSYPTLYIKSKEGLNLPDGDFTVLIKGRKVKETEDTRDEENPTYSCEIEVQSIGEPQADKSGDTGMVNVGDALKSAMRNKLGKSKGMSMGMSQEEGE